MTLELCGFKRKVDMFEINDETKRLKSSCSTRLEDLSNELIHEIFDYLDDWEIYELFFQMNIRFQLFFTSPNFRLKLNLPLTSKSMFHHRCIHLIKPNVDRIISLSLSHYLTTNDFLNSFSIDSFIHLERLNLIGVSSTNLILLLTRLATLSRFVSLSITCIDNWKNAYVIYQCIFRLSTIKYCKLTFLNHGDRNPLPYAIDKQDQCQTLEYLIIDSWYSLSQINAVLTYTPRLTHLFCRIASALCSNIADGPAVLLHLTHLTVDFYQLSFDEFEIFLIQMSRQLIFLRLTVSCNGTFFSSDRWEQLILNHIPHLRIFDFQYNMSPEYPINDENLNFVPIDQFISTFWSNRNWCFEYQYWPDNDDDEPFPIVFYSTHPYRRKYYELIECIDDEDIEIHSASHLTIRQQMNTITCSSHFPNITKLTLNANFLDENGQFIRDINRIISLSKLKYLLMDEQELRIDQLIELLTFTSNIHSLTFAQMFFLDFHSLSIEQTDMFHQISMKNKITELNIEHGCTLEHLKFFVNLCPRLQHLTIGISETSLESILKFLLSNKDSNLFSLRILNTNKETINEIIRREILLENYSIEYENSAIHLWW
ncbi:unnamed protein product [Rotaria sordida]|uniref:F-box domain-containing protein n=1 Tax=Rotaria sordida TaxID=392033 RepID=A0A819KU39_9BILA|nr:unnamed protein product [Rotaria sordida]